ncbi:hypothetical protein [Streptomyces sp. NPDC000618]|uniref:hypothetical protein n=1 Tax=Streptomyces sp. NPDC000618 TaxID=3154265 RepID=UPI0033334E70
MSRSTSHDGGSPCRPTPPTPPCPAAGSGISPRLRHLCSTGAVTGEQTAGWIAEQRERAEADRLFLALPMF